MKNRNRPKAGSIGVLDGAAVVAVMAAGLIINVVSGGIRNNVGIIIDPISVRTGLAYADVSFALALLQLLYGVTQPLWGALALKRSNVTVLKIGVPLLASGLILTTFCTSRIMLDCCLGFLVGSAAGALSMGMIMGAITPVLGKERAALTAGIISAGSGIGAALLAPILQAVNDALGISYTLIILGTTVLVLLPVVFWMGKKSKAVHEDFSLDAETDYRIGETLREAARESDLILVSLAFFTCGFHMVFINTHFVAQMLDGGISEAKAASIYMLFGIGAMIGSVLAGALCQKIQFKNVLALAYGLRVPLVLLMIVVPMGVPAMVFLSFFFGLTGDASVAPTQQIVSARFGAKKSAMLFGIAFISHQIGGFISSWIGGILIQNGGHYQTMWIVDMVLCGIASVLAYMVAKDKQSFYKV